MTDAFLALEDGTVYPGRAFGAPATAAGEAVFNTSMAGYQEVLTDPSYRGQIVTMTYPLIGNYGTTPEDGESKQVQVSGFVVRELTRVPSNFRSTRDLDGYLKDAGVPASTQWLGAGLGVVGFFVVPVVGLPLGFVLGVYLAEYRRVGGRAAWPSTVHALKAAGLSILIELAAGVAAALVWVVGLVVT